MPQPRADGDGVDRAESPGRGARPDTRFGLHLSRVAHRVAQGGHDVPQHVVERRYRRSLENFLGLYRPLANNWTVCDNSGNELVFVAEGDRSGDITAFDRDRFELIQRSGHGEK